MDLISYGGIHRLYTAIYRPSKYLFLLCLLFLEKVMENIFFKKLRNGKVQDKKFKSF